MKSTFVSLLLVLVLTNGGMEGAQGFSCEIAKIMLIPCLDFVTDKVDTPSTACCRGLSAVKASAPTKDDVRAACKCLKEGITHIPNLNFQRAQELPTLCDVDVGFPITKDVNCTKTGGGRNGTLKMGTLLGIFADMEASRGYNCDKARRSVLPCLSFVMDNADAPSTQCCKGVKEVKASAPSKPELRAACLCIKEALFYNLNLNYRKVKALPGLCKVDLGFPVSINVNCDR
ncbi:unnamed protein product [Sphenostylis stenocarpa]|uniref:Non-specific lipid-transfer protein n=1 Tax=Sphenostylis stenocarpa TaxID=92480 RepID=A0AA86T446_9FABA|nr:unnamed protein product [Sphenostylis stenocarpa]